MNDYSEQSERLKQALSDADAVVIGAGAGLSTAAGFSYGGERFKSTSRILKKNTAFGTCTPAASTPSPLLRNSGHSGAAAFSSIDT